MQKLLAAIALIFIVSCQKAVSDLKPAAAAANFGKLVQGAVKATATSGVQEETTHTDNQYGGQTVRVRFLDRSYFFANTDCTGAVVELSGGLYYSQTTVYDSLWNEMALKTRLILAGVGTTSDGERFTVREFAKEDFDFTSAKPGGIFHVKAVYKTAHHGGTITYEVKGFYNAITNTYEYQINSIVYDCN